MNFKFSLFKSTVPLQFTIWVNLFIEGITSIDYLNCFYYIDTYLSGSEVSIVILVLKKDSNCYR